MIRKNCKLRIKDISTSLGKLAKYLTILKHKYISLAKNVRGKNRFAPSIFLRDTEKKLVLKNFIMEAKEYAKKSL